MRRQYLSISFFLLCVAGSTVAVQQAAAQAGTSPLGFQTIFSRIGVQAGIDLTGQDGRYTVGCGEFTEGSKVNLSVGIAWDTPLGELFKLEGIAGYRQRNVSGSYVTTEPSVVRTADGFIETDLDYDNRGEARLAYLFAQSSIMFFPVDALYLGAGVNIGLNVGAKTQYTRDILTRTVTGPDGTIVEAFYPSDESSDPHSKVFPEETPESVAAVLIDPVGYAGFEIRAGRDFFIGPRVTYGLPVIPALSEPDLKLNSILITLDVRYNLR